LSFVVKTVLIVPQTVAHKLRLVSTCVGICRRCSILKTQEGTTCDADFVVFGHFF